MTKSNNWKSLIELQEPYNDTVNYRTRKQKEFFTKIFLKTDDLASCLKPSIYFLIGEKGSGKTAYAAYLEANKVSGTFTKPGTKSKLTTMTESQYRRFIELKRKGKLAYSDYANIWRPMLLNMACQAIIDKSKGFVAELTGKFKKIETEISKFNTTSLNPEVEVAFEMVREASIEASLEAPGTGKVGGKIGEKNTDKVEVIKHHLLTTEERLKVALGELKLSDNQILFIDGIDYRPTSVPYIDYIECIKGLGEAAWNLNNEFFSNIRDSKGRIKIVLLVRPDVFQELHLYNANSRLQDNSVYLDWATTEQHFRESRLYEATGKFFSEQQNFNADPIPAADNYLAANEGDTIFKKLLKISFQKPRDILTFIRIARSSMIGPLRAGSSTAFQSQIISNPEFTRQYSDYLLGEARDYAAFYMDQIDFGLYIKFFQYLNGKLTFNFSDFEKAFDSFKNWIDGENVKTTSFLRDAEALLQFFYDVNLIGYKENMSDAGDSFFHWSFRERSLNNIAPKIKNSGTLIINIGIAKALDIGKRATTSNAGNKSRKAKFARPPKRNSPKQENLSPQKNPISPPQNQNPVEKPPANTARNRRRRRRGSPPPLSN